MNRINNLYCVNCSVTLLLFLFGLILVLLSPCILYDVNVNVDDKTKYCIMGNIGICFFLLAIIFFIVFLYFINRENRKIGEHTRLLQYITNTYSSKEGEEEEEV